MRWSQFLARKPLEVDGARAAEALGGKRILITGAGGWIGSALARAIAKLAPEHLLLMEASERGLYEIDSTLQQMPIAKASILGSVSDPAVLADLFRRYRPQIVYHAAAFKHVPLMEQNPFAAVENNAIGTHLLVDAARQSGVEQVLLLSTDKAVDPINMMGATKRIAELVLLAYGTVSTTMKALRLGNVLASEGSVVPLFRKQICAGGPVTVTHPDACRYFLTTNDAVTLLLEAASAEPSRCILVPDLGEPLRMEALARFLLAEHGSPATVVFTQLRPGDKLSESLLSAREAYVDDQSTALLRSVNSPALSPAALGEVLQQLQQACKQRSLEMLVRAVLRAVPEYQPSALLLSALAGSCA